jgi:hypothetical protein
MRICIIERIHHQRLIDALAHGPAHHRARVKVEKYCQVESARPGGKWSERPGVVELFPGLSSPNRTCTSQRIRLSIQVLLKAKATSA